MNEFEELQIDGYMKNHNYKLVNFAKNECIMEAPITENSLNPYKIAHGGFIYGLMDTCGGVHIFLDTKRKVVTTTTNMNFLRPLIGTKLITKSTPIRIGKRMCVMKVDAYNDINDLVATGIFNYYYKD